MSTSQPKPGIRVLLVEDHAWLRGLLAKTLMAAGFRVMAAESGDRAAAMLEAGYLPDLLLSDVGMPGRLDGFDLSKLTRERFPGVVILLQTGFPDVDTGDFPVLRKPFDPDTLLDTIDDLLRRAGRVEGP